MNPVPLSMDRLRIVSWLLCLPYLVLTLYSLLELSEPT